MFFPLQDTPASCFNTFFVFSASPFEDCQRRRYGKVLFCKHGVCTVFLIYVFFFKITPFQLSVLMGFLLGSLLYEQLGMKAFGMPGKLAASGSITMQNIGGEGKILK